MASKKKPSSAQEPQDESVYRVKHISRSAWEDGRLSLPGLQPQWDDTIELDDIAMDMAMTGEIPLELIRGMLRKQELEQAAEKPEPSGVGMILPEEIVAMRKKPETAEIAQETPTPDEVAAAKAEMRAMRSKSRLPQTEKPVKSKKEKPEKQPKPVKIKEEKPEKQPKPVKIKEEKPAREPKPVKIKEEKPAREPKPVKIKEEKPEKQPKPVKIKEEKPAREPKPVKIKEEKPVKEAKPVIIKEEKPAKEAKPVKMKEEKPMKERKTSKIKAEKHPKKAPKLAAAPPDLPESAYGDLWFDALPLYSFPIDRVLRAAYRSLYYYGLRFVRPLRIFGHYTLPYLKRPVLVLWHLARAFVITLHHITIGYMRKEVSAARELHAKRLEEREGSVNRRTAVRGLLEDYSAVLRPAVNTMMPLAALAVLLIVIQGVSSTTYALNVDYYGNDLGYIANESVFLQAQSAANSNITPKPEIAALIEEAEEPEKKEAEQNTYAQFSIARVQPEQLTSVDVLTDQLLENSPKEMTSAYGVYISDEEGENTRLFATIKNSTDADSVLNSIKNTKSADLKRSDSATVGFVQTVDLVQGFYPTEQLVDAQTLLKDLTQPEQEAVPITVKSGDTISGIQSEYGLSMATLYALNPGLKGNETKLMPGDTLIVEAEVANLEVKVVQTEVRTQEVAYETKNNDNYSLYRGEVRVRTKGENGTDQITERVTYINGVRYGEPEVISVKRVKEPVTEVREVGRKSTTVRTNDGTVIKINPSALGFTWPVPSCSTVSSPYGYRGRGFHRGIDISNGRTNGKVIVAAKDGVVELVQRGGSSYGHQVVINHGNGVKTRYAHMYSGSISVRQGERVSIGQPIGRVGSTGNSTGPHLHFEVIINGSTQNPLNYVRRP